MGWSRSTGFLSQVRWGSSQGSSCSCSIGGEASHAAGMTHGSGHWGHPGMCQTRWHVSRAYRSGWHMESVTQTYVWISDCDHKSKLFSSILLNRCSLSLMFCEKVHKSMLRLHLSCCSESPGGLHVLSSLCKPRVDFKQRNPTKCNVVMKIMVGIPMAAQIPKSVNTQSREAGRCD